MLMTRPLSTNWSFPAMLQATVTTIQVIRSLADPSLDLACDLRFYFALLLRQSAVNAIAFSATAVAVMPGL